MNLKKCPLVSGSGVSTCRGACSTERDVVVVVGDAAKKARKGSIDTNIFGGAAPSEEGAISRFPEH